jgi:GTP-binding protein
MELGMKKKKSTEVRTAALPTVAIVGRPNVGKSSLFNCMVGRRVSIVHEESGVTRDRIAALAYRDGGAFQVVDTGGLGVYAGEIRNVDRWTTAIGEQVDAAIAGADLLVMVADAAAGLTPLDSEIAARLRASDKPVLLTVNKADNPRLEGAADEFAQLGFSPVYPVSCLHRIGLDDLLDAVAEHLPGGHAPPEPELRLAVVGRPNVGKSSLVNRLLGEPRVLVSEIAGTTRDAVDVPVRLKFGQDEVSALLIDTAGLRQRRRADTAVEMFSILRAESAIQRAQVVLFVLEAGRTGPTAQDRRIARMIGDAGRGCIIVANKWDLCDDIKKAEAIEQVRYGLPFLTFAPVVFVSAKTGHQFDRMLDEIGSLREQLGVRLSTGILNRVLGDAIARTPPPSNNGRFFKMYYATMTGDTPPTFLLFVNDPKLCLPSYKQYLAKALRKQLGMTALPIRIELRARSRREEKKK